MLYNAYIEISEFCGCCNNSRRAFLELKKDIKSQGLFFCIFASVRS